jgi:hypothetical protein
MLLHETKTCPRCKESFECRSGNITQCHCYGVELTAELRAFVEQRFNDCLCLDCLRYLQQEHNNFKEKYFPK